MQGVKLVVLQIFEFLPNMSLVMKTSHILSANSGNPDQMPHVAASDMGLHCLHMSHKKDVRLILVKE